MMFVGCLGEQAPIEDNDTQTEPPPVPVVKPPSFTILSPGEGETVFTEGDSLDVTLALSTQNLVLRQPGGAAKKGEGHMRVSVDGGPAVVMVGKNLVLSSIAPGEHTIEVEVVNNDQSSYSPMVKRSVAFTIERTKPAEYEPSEYTVTINDFAYAPAELTVMDQDSVAFVNEGAYPRSATCFIDGKQVFDTGVLGPGASKTIQMEGVFECEYYSTTHRAMTGMITVQSNGVD
jgi:plastocyanin